ncbi:MAG: ADP-ribosylglycohydrolase family protein, partial [Myxococcota bacterium]
MNEPTEGQFAGCVVGLAVGDALGYPAEFRRRAELQQALGAAGVTGFLAIDDPRFERPVVVGKPHPPGTFTDDTQMTLALAEGLLRAGGTSLDTRMQAIAEEFIAWSESSTNDRAPGNTCMAGCANLAAGRPWRLAGVPDSKGCGSAMRVAPIALLYRDVEELLEVARASSLLTHGHDAAVEGAAAVALMVHHALYGASPKRLYDEVARRCGGRSQDFDRCWAALEGLMTAPPELALSKAGLGEAWVADEAAASGLYCFHHSPDDYREAVLVA